MYNINVPPDLIPKTEAELREIVGQLRVICNNQETKLQENDEDKRAMDARIKQLELINAADSAVRKFTKYLISIALAVAGLYLTYRTIGSTKQ